MTTSRQEELLERGVRALERMAEDPVIQVETNPPVCPYCEKVNPEVRIHEREGTGPLAEFVIEAQCLSCNRVFYGLPYQWGTTRTVEEIRQLIEEKVETGGYERNNSGA